MRRSASEEACADEEAAPRAARLSWAAAVMAAYLWSFPKARLLQTIPFLLIQVKIPAWIYVVIWLALHCLTGFFTDTLEMAWFIHIGGFVSGLAATPRVLRGRRRRVANRVDEARGIITGVHAPPPPPAPPPSPPVLPDRLQRWPRRDRRRDVDRTVVLNRIVVDDRSRGRRSL